jgi:hypothetical protein
MSSGASLEVAFNVATLEITRRRYPQIRSCSIYQGMRSITLTEHSKSHSRTAFANLSFYVYFTMTETFLRYQVKKNVSLA